MLGGHYISVGREGDRWTLRAMCGVGTVGMNVVFECVWVGMKCLMLGRLGGPYMSLKGR